MSRTPDGMAVATRHSPLGVAVTNQTPSSQVNSVPRTVFKTGAVLLVANCKPVSGISSHCGVPPSNAGAVAMRAVFGETRRLSTVCLCVEADVVWGVSALATLPSESRNADRM
jgi:hypothetical protein